MDKPVAFRRAVATIGIFDGVHRGHRFILSKLKEEALKHGGESVVVSLWPHPRIVLDKDLDQFKLLHSREEKIRELERAGVDHLVLIPFSRELASLSACDFVQQYLVDRMGVEVLLLGYDNRFGRDRRGDPDGLRLCASENDFEIIKLPELPELPDIGSGKRISSTHIREVIIGGDMEAASSMLGYPYYLAGEVVEGNHLGRQMGFPTANVHPTDPYKLIPMNGVYAIRAEMDGRSYDGMLNIGFRPTLDSALPVKTIEAHLFDTSGDFYGKRITIHFLARVRDEMKFKGLDALKQQLKKDEHNIRKLLKDA